MAATGCGQETTSHWRPMIAGAPRQTTATASQFASSAWLVVRAALACGPCMFLLPLMPPFGMVIGTESRPLAGRRKADRPSAVAHIPGRAGEEGHATAPLTPPHTSPLTAHLTVLTPRTDTFPRKNAGIPNCSATVRAPLRARLIIFSGFFFSLFLHTQGHLMRWTPPISHTPPNRLRLFGLEAKFWGLGPYNQSRPQAATTNRAGNAPRTSTRDGLTALGAPTRNPTVA